MAEFEWDPAKAAANYRKHSVHFADAVGVFSDDFALTIEDTSANEERFRTLGVDFLGRVLVVAYTYRGDTIRLISARQATARQRASYEGTRR
ncbi:MAG TPA: BrnT family toxin [Thermoanaerobaculia bacterium]|nr:BrnT family toxin [Thermoanaerobaculia bacterium]